MTLFTVLIVMALERVTTKSKQFHIANLANHYFSFILETKWFASLSGIIACLLVAACPAIAAYFLMDWLPGILMFLASILVLWICLGCPVTRNTYKRYLQAANRDDFEACSLHSMSFGNEGGQLDNVGKQLVLVNYRQYASVLLFFILTGVPGLIFYSLVKEWARYQNDKLNTALKEQGESEVSSQAQPADQGGEIEKLTNAHNDALKILFILDWIPVRITTFGFLVVGHFTNAFNAWFDILLNGSMSSYDALAKVARAAEDVRTNRDDNKDVCLNEPLQLVKLVKRNIVFILIALSVATMVGVVS
ncbi:regulatory signaling modulator protein AmpE [Ningiella sp. W23]|uniref:regulatory signaling modulator protein AmpE n=1 Tax=Ningiella sp. W23 TaxID=3023715 RepID=UPI0037564BA4